MHGWVGGWVGGWVVRGWGWIREALSMPPCLFLAVVSHPVARQSCASGHHGSMPTSGGTTRRHKLSEHMCIVMSERDKEELAVLEDDEEGGSASAKADASQVVSLQQAVRLATVDNFQASSSPPGLDAVACSWHGTPACLDRWRPVLLAQEWEYRCAKSIVNGGCVLALCTGGGE